MGQDSVAAMRALVEYAHHDTSRNAYHLQVDVRAGASPNFSETVMLEGTYFADDFNIQVRNRNLLYMCVYATQTLCTGTL